jgi:hypothetical protein
MLYRACGVAARGKLATPGPKGAVFALAGARSSIRWVRGDASGGVLSSQMGKDSPAQSIESSQADYACFQVHSNSRVCGRDFSFCQLTANAWSI